MRRPRTRLLIVPIVTLVVIHLGGLACSKAEPTATPQSSAEPTTTPQASRAYGTPQAPAEWADYTTQTASYRITVRTGPMVTMEVMQMGAAMTTVDQSQPVNHHLEVHVFDKISGTEVKDLVPKVRITDLGTGGTREFGVDRHPSGEVPYVTACLLSNHRVKEPHFGDNLHLRDGTYTIAIGVGNETTVLENIIVKAIESSGV